MVIATTLWSLISSRVHEVLSGIEETVSGFTTIDFILVVVVFWAIYWVCSTLRAVTRLGPVEVALLDANGDVKPDVYALTALLRAACSGRPRATAPGPRRVPPSQPDRSRCGQRSTAGGMDCQGARSDSESPRSPEYKVSGTLLRTAPHPPDRLRYWLQPKYSGASETNTVPPQPSADDVIRYAAAEIFLGIARDVPHVFPRWAHWGAPGAATDYVDGSRGGWAKTIPAPRRSLKAPGTLRLRTFSRDSKLANIHEAEASMNGAGAREQAEALREYLYIGVARPDVVASPGRRPKRNTLP